MKYPDEGHIGSALELVPFVFNTVTLNVGGIPYNMAVPMGTRVADEITGMFYEQNIIEDMMNKLKPSDTFWDVGASTGTHAIPAAMALSENGIVYAFEPDEVQAQLIAHNVSLNPSMANQAALVQIVKDTPLWHDDAYITLHSSGLAGKAPRVTLLGQSANTPYATFEQAVVLRARTIGSLVANDGLRPPDVLKIDVEGAGLHVVRGLGPIRPRHIYIELHPLYNETELDSIALLLEHGYDIGLKERRGNQIICRFDRIAMQPDAA